MIEAWKKQYEAIYQVTIVEIDFIFRPIGREEYKQILEMGLPLGESQELICEKVVLSPAYDFTSGIGGVAEAIYEMVIEVSGLIPGQGKVLLDSYREEMMNFDYQADCIIHEAFPEFSIEEIQTWSVKKTMYYLARAEWVLNVIRRIPLIPFEEQIQQQEIMPPPPMPQPQPQASPVQDHHPDQSLTQEDVERMLSEVSGEPVRMSSPTDLFPELSWFKAEEDLKGEWE